MDSLVHPQENPISVWGGRGISRGCPQQGPMVGPGGADDLVNGAPSLGEFPPHRANEQDGAGQIPGAARWCRLRQWRPPPLPVVCRPLSRISQDSICIHNLVELLCSGLPFCRDGVGRACIGVMGAHQSPIGACHRTGCRRGCQMQNLVWIRVVFIHGPGSRPLILPSSLNPSRLCVVAGTNFITTGVNLKQGAWRRVIGRATPPRRVRPQPSGRVYLSRS